MARILSRTPAALHREIFGLPVQRQRQDVGNNATPTTGDPEYSGEFTIASYVPAIENGKAVTFEASLKPATGTSPSWGTM